MTSIDQIKNNINNASIFDLPQALIDAELYDEEDAHKVVEQVYADFEKGGNVLDSIVKPTFFSIFDGLLQCGCLNDDWITICPAALDFIWSLRECLGLCISVYDDLSDWNTAIYGCSRNESFYQCSGIFNNRNVFGCNWSNCKFTT